MPGKTYILHMAGVPLDEESLQTIPCPRWELTAHVTHKCIQSGAVLGSLSALATAMVTGERDKNDIVNRVTRYGMVGINTGLVVGPLMTLATAYAKDMDMQGFYDRAYSIRNNKSQLRVDRMSLVGALAGAGAAVVLGREGATGAVLGISAGVLLGAFCNATIG